jgi:hypothetical protein
MTSFKFFLAIAAALVWSTAMPAVAGTSLGSSASDSASSAASSASDSLKTSSGSSKTNAVAQGDYTITEVAAVDDKPGSVRLTLQLVADAGGQSNELFLYVPAKVHAQGDLNVGQIVAARTRPYGVEFAKGEPREAFFLVLDDEVYRELNSVAVAL